MLVFGKHTTKQGISILKKASIICWLGNVRKNRIKKANRPSSRMPNNKTHCSNTNKLFSRKVN